MFDNLKYVWVNRAKRSGDICAQIGRERQAKVPSEPGLWVDSGGYAPPRSLPPVLNGCAGAAITSPCNHSFVGSITLNASLASYPYTSYLSDSPLSDYFVKKQ